MITIEKNVPMPDGDSIAEDIMAMQIKTMEVGDSFVICDTYSRASSIHAKFKAVGYKAAMRSERTDSHTSRGLREFRMRFWRVG